jgi:Icc-related predicted phosphoesterase
LEIPKGIHIVVFSGDATNPRDLVANEWQMRDFLEWFRNLPIRHKVMIAGNHDLSIEKGLVKAKEIKKMGIIYLENNYATIRGLKFFGSPHTPAFGSNWAFTKHRSLLHDIWRHVTDDVDVFVVHGPPKTLLDKAYNKDTGALEHSGCQALRTHILNRIRPKAVLFGHLHNNEDLLNAGVLQLSGRDTIYSNGSVVTDGKFGFLSSNGNILEL